MWNVATWNTSRTVPDFAYGDLVVDRDDQKPDLAVVVNRPGIPQSEWDIPGEETLAADNPTYDSDADVVVVMFYEDIRTWDPEWADFEGTDRSLEEIAESSRYFAFPRPRLKHAPAGLIEDQFKPREATAEMYSRLKSNSSLSCEYASEEVIRVSALGTEYLVRPGKLITGDGPLAARLSSMAEEYEA